MANIKSGEVLVRFGVF